MCHFLPIPVDMFSVNTTYRSSIPLDLGLQQQLWGPKRGALANPCADGEEVDWGAASSSAPLMFKRMIGNSANRFIYLYFFIFLTTYMFIYIYANSCFSILFRGDGSPSRTPFEKRARTTWTPVNKVAQPTSWCRKFHVDPFAILFFVCLHDPFVSPVSHISSIPTVDVVLFSLYQDVSNTINFLQLPASITHHIFSIIYI